MNIRPIFILIALVAIISCSKKEKPFKETDGYNHADSIVNDIGDARDFPRVLAVTDSLQRLGQLSQVKVIFYSTIAYNLMGQRRNALQLYYQLATIDEKELKTQADIESYIYSYKDYVRLLCDMRRYDRALREVYNADHKLKAAGYDSFMDHHDITQMIGECQLYLDQASEAAKSFQKSLMAIHKRLASFYDPIDLLECQKTMNAIAKAYIYTGRYDEAQPWIKQQDALYEVAVSHPQRDSVYVDEMKAEINYSKALLAHAQGYDDDADRAFAIYQSTRTSKQLNHIISSNEYLMQTRRYEEAARNYTQLDKFLKENGYKADLETFGRYLIPKYRANLLAGHRDSAIYVATLVAEYYDTALVRQKIIDSDLLATVYDNEGKERQIVEQRAELSQQRLFTIAIVMIVIVIFFHIYVIQRRKAFNKLNETNRQLMLANERVAESSRMKTKFIQQISHEVRTPLNVLSGFSQVLGNRNFEIDADELQDISQKIVQNSDRITHLMDKMLDLSLLNTDADIECHDTVSPADIATQAVNISRIRKAAHLEFQLQVSPEAESLSIVVNQISAVKALTQLLDNAIKFTNPKTYRRSWADNEKAHVTLSVDVAQQQVNFVVEDTGIGVPPEQAENIFTEFVQLNEYSEGTGIGLSIARSLVRRMKGDITLDTTYTTGARFVMSLPLSVQV